MSIKDRLREKSGDLSAKAPQQPESSAATGNTSPRTGPGQMLAFRSQTIEQRSKGQELEDKLKQFDDSIPARKIDASMIQPSHWANRHESSFADVDFIS